MREKERTRKRERRRRRKRRIERESVLKERRKSVIEKGSLALSLFPSSQVRDETRKGEIERDRKRTRIGERKESERANGRTSGGERGGCCCCGRGITSAPLTRKTFRLNLVLDSARLRSTHPNRPAFLARPKRFADLHPFSPTHPLSFT